MRLLPLCLVLVAAPLAAQLPDRPADSSSVLTIFLGNSPVPVPVKLRQRFWAEDWAVTRGGAPFGAWKTWGWLITDGVDLINPLPVDTVQIPAPLPSGVDSLKYGADSTRYTWWHTGRINDSTKLVRATPPPPPPPPPTDTNHVGPQVRTAAQWSGAIAGSYGKAGDTVWIRTGSYAGGNLAASNRIYRCWPGERCTTRPMVTTGSSVTIWGMECTDPALGSQCIDAHAPGTRLINNVVHDAGHSGIGLWWYTQGGEAYGNIVWNNGKDDNLDHGIYFNNKTGTMRLRDNVVFDNWAYGIHGYSSTPGELTGLSLDGNVAFGGHGIGAFNSTDIMIGGAAISSISVTNQFTYKPDGYISAVIGRPDGPSNGSATVSGYFVGDSALQTAKWASVNRSNVTAIRYASRPSSGTQVYVRPNAYEAGRAHVIVYNWGKAATVAIDLSSAVKVGQPYAVRNVCDLWGSPLASSGSYDGKPVTLSMASFAAPKPIGRTWKRPAPDCGGQFATFLVQAK